MGLMTSDENRTAKQMSPDSHRGLVAVHDDDDSVDDCGDGGDDEDGDTFVSGTCAGGQSQSTTTTTTARISVTTAAMATSAAERLTATGATRSTRSYFRRIKLLGSHISSDERPLE